MVSLGMKGSRFSWVNFENGYEHRPEVGDKDETVVRDNRIGKAMELDDIGDKESYKIRSRYSFRVGDEIHHLGYSVDKYKNRVVAI